MGTGFIGYLGMGAKFFNVLVTNNHVIKSVGDAMGCQLKFENAFDRGRHCTVKLCDAIAEAPDNFWTSSENEVCVCSYVCVCSCVCVFVSVRVCSSRFWFIYYSLCTLTVGFHHHQID